MPEPLPPGEPRVDVLVRMLREHSDELGVVLRRYDSLVLKSLISIGLLLAFPLAFFAWYLTAPAELLIAKDVLELVTLIGVSVMLTWAVLENVNRKSTRVDLDLVAFHLRMVYELASRIDDVGRPLDFWVSYELNMRLAKAQYLLQLVARRGFPHKDAAAGLRALPKAPAAAEAARVSAPMGDLSVATDR